MECRLSASVSHACRDTFQSCEAPNGCSMAMRFAFAGMFQVPNRADVVLVYSPPLFLGLSALAIRWFRCGKVIVNIQDLFPQSAIDLGVLKSRFLISMFRKIESRIYRKANRITVHSEGNRQHVIHCGGFAERTIDVPNPVDDHSIVPGPRENEFRKNMGVESQPPCSLVCRCHRIVARPRYRDRSGKAALGSPGRCVLHCRGWDREAAIGRKGERSAECSFSPDASRPRIRPTLHASDVCLVTLHKEVKTPVVPSKILSIMAAGRPILASLPLNGDAPKIIADAKCGECIGPNDPATFAATVRKMCLERDRFAAMGKRGREYVVRHFSLDGCATVYERIFQSIS